MINQGWPTESKPFDSNVRRVYEYLKSTKSLVRVAMENAKHGGKKGKKAAPKKGAEEEKKSGPENGAIFVAIEYPEFKKKTIEVLA